MQTPSSRLEGLKKRIIKKLACPELFEDPPSRCLPWPTKAVPSRHIIRLIRPPNGGAYMASTIVKSLPRLMYKGEALWVHRVIYEILHPATSSVPRGQQTCKTAFCVNPDHWAFAALDFDPETPGPEPEPPVEGDDWTLSDAQDLLDMYLNQHPHPPLDPDHNLLVDIPRPLLLTALQLIQKEDFLP